MCGWVEREGENAHQAKDSEREKERERVIDAWTG